MAKNLNRVLAFGIATAMVFGSSLTAFAEGETTITGTGSEANVITDVYAVTLPTGDALNKTLNFIVDPEGVAVAAKAAFGADVTVNDNNGVLFKNTDGDKVTVSGTSDKISIVNKSYKPVDLEVTFKLAGAASGGYAAGLSSTSDFTGTGDSVKGLYFALSATSEADKVFTVIGDGAATSYKNVIASDAAEYELKGTNAGDATTYAYTIKTDATGKSYDFQITGAMNPTVPLTTWQTTATDGTVTAKAMPTITMTVKPTQNKSAIGVAKWNSGWGFDFGVAADGGLLAAPTSVTWNGKEIAGDIAFKDGWATISWSQLITAYNTACGTEYTTSKYDDKIWKGTNTLQFSVGDQTYIAEIK